VNILLATSELTPLTRAGQMADFCHGLATELARAGHRVAVALPAYREVLARRPKLSEVAPLAIPIGNRTVEGKLVRTAPLGKVEVYLVAQDHYFDRPGLYQQSGQDYVDNCERFVFFCRGVMEAVGHLGWPVDVLHANDWQTGLLPAYLLAEYRGVPGYEQIASVFTVHNACFQGQFWHWDMMLTGLDWRYFNWQQMEFYGNLNLLKTALVFSDAITTVSPAYAREIQSPPVLLETNETGLTRPIELPGGCGLEGVFSARRDVLIGITSGLDDEPSSEPRSDSRAAASEGPQTPAARAAHKQSLQQELSLRGEPAANASAGQVGATSHGELEARRVSEGGPGNSPPLVAVVGPLNDQHGMDLTLAVMQTWLTQHEAQWVVCGQPSQPYRASLPELAKRFAGKLAVRLDPDDALTRRVLAAADIVISASRFGPGNPLHVRAMRLGAVPVAFASGLMADVGIDAAPEAVEAGRANSFLFTKYSTSALHTALTRATAAYRTPTTWSVIRRAAMQVSPSWRDAARAYLDVYERASQRLKRAALA